MSSVNPDRQQIILSTFDDLLGRIDHITTTQVDSEMYWRCCFPEEYAKAYERKEAFELARSRLAGKGLNKIQEFEAILDGWYAEDRDPSVSRISIQDIHAGLQSWVLGEDLNVWPVYASYSGHSKTWINKGNHLPTDGSPDQHIDLWISDPSIRGAAAELMIRREAQAAYPTIRQEHPELWWSLHVGLSFVDGDPNHPDPIMRFPTIVLSVKVPLPSPGLIQDIFDRVAVDEKGWTSKLGGAADDQTPLVALRAWAIGLLVGAGCSVKEATDMIVDRGGLAWVTSTRFNEDRATIIARVPMAAPFLFQRPRKNKDKTTHWG